jgi:hypothetical protein
LAGGRWQVADSPKLNGAFKIALTKTKQLFYEIKTRKKGSTNFEMTDIIPLVSHTWKQSFTNNANAKKAIGKRGWGPLNYALLDHPDVRKPFLKSSTNELISTTESSCSSYSSFDPITLNLKSGFANDLMEKIITEVMKDKSRVDTLNEKKRKMSEMNSNNEQLKLLTRILSGSLAGVGRYHITSEVKDVNVEDCNIKQQKEDMKENKRQQKKSNETKKYINATMKDRESQQLTYKDLKILIWYHHCADDSPVKTKIRDLRLQWNRSRHRILFNDINQSQPSINNVYCNQQLPVEVSEMNVRNSSIQNAFHEEEECISSLALFSSNARSTSTDESVSSNNIVSL